MPEPALPRVFVIGQPMTGGTLVRHLFEANGHLWRHHLDGRLAEDIAYSEAAGQPPLRRWGRAQGFSGLHCTHRKHLPPLEAWRSFRYLHRHFPEAYFIHTHRDPAEWVAERYFAENGAARDLAAWHRGVGPAALPEIWLAELARHRAGCASYFAGNPRYIDINISSQSIDILCEKLSDTFDLQPPDDMPDLYTDPNLIRRVLEQMEQPEPDSTLPKPDTDFADRVARHCLGTQGRSGPPKALSTSAVQWRADTPERFFSRDGAQIGMLRSGGRVLLAQGEGKYERAQAALDEMARHGGLDSAPHETKPPIWVDMMDARYAGSQGRRAAPHNTVVYNRREGAENLILWPLPGYHSLAPRGAPCGYPRDDIAFADKADTCAWRGNMTGRMIPELTPEHASDAPELQTVYALRDRALALTSKASEQVTPHDWDALIADFDCTPRYRTLRRFANHPDFDLGFVLRGDWKRLASSPLFADFVRPKVPATWFHDYRYVLSLSGNDTGSNFLMAAASNSVVLKEDDGWELFYTEAFKAWVHYIPLARGAQDVAEKLAWARANPRACADMAHAATALYDAFAAPANRAAILERIIAGLRAG